MIYKNQLHQLQIFLQLFFTVKFHNKIPQHFSAGVFYNIFLHLFSTIISRQHLQQIFRQHLLQVFLQWLHLKFFLFFILAGPGITAFLWALPTSSNIYTCVAVCIYPCIYVYVCNYVYILYVYCLLVILVGI